MNKIWFIVVCVAIVMTTTYLLWEINVWAWHIHFLLGVVVSLATLVPLSAALDAAAKTQPPPSPKSRASGEEEMVAFAAAIWDEAEATVEEYREGKISKDYLQRKLWNLRDMLPQ